MINNKTKGVGAWNPPLTARNWRNRCFCWSLLSGAPCFSVCSPICWWWLPRCTCWKCITVCSRQVIGKVDFWGHKHSHIDNAIQCIGCLRCVQVCHAQAIKQIPKLKEKYNHGYSYWKKAFQQTRICFHRLIYFRFNSACFRYYEPLLWIRSFIARTAFLDVGT